MPELIFQADCVTLCMSLRLWQIEHEFTQTFGINGKAGFRKWLKNQRNRKIRQIKQTEIPNIKYGGWEY
jgi:hypothetical protein